MKISQELLDRCRAIPVAVLNDVMVKAGCPDRVLSHELRSFDSHERFAGPAFCVRGESTGGKPAPADVRFDMYRRIEAGAVLVMASGGYRTTAILGENMCTALQQKGCLAVLLDGGYRDRGAIDAMGLPVRARFVTPVASSGRFVLAELDVPVQLPGQSTPSVKVCPGDVIVADEEGVIVIPRHGVASIVEDAEQVIAAEERTRALIVGGADAEQAYKANDRFSHVRKIGAST